MRHDDTYTRMAKAIAFMVERQDERPALDAIAARVRMSPFHFQRRFVEWAGVSPKEFQQAMTLERAKALLARSPSLLDATFELGLSSGSRLHELFARIEHLTPGDYRRLGRGLEIAWSVAPTRFGAALFATTPRGLCHLSFLDGRRDPRAVLRREWAQATLRESPRAIAPYAREVGRRMSGLTPRSRLGLLLKGTPFRVKVWRALLELPAGQVISYAQLAATMGEPRAVRAVASGIAENPIAWLIPCHRVIRSSGAIGEYHWGAARKAAMLAIEQTHDAGAERVGSDAMRAGT